MYRLFASAARVAMITNFVPQTSSPVPSACNAASVSARGYDTSPVILSTRLSHRLGAEEGGEDFAIGVEDHVLKAMDDGQDRRDNGVLVLTSNLPKPGSPGDRALRAVGPRVIFDVVELYDPAGLGRLRYYAEAQDPSPLPGFWTESELAGSPQ